MINKSIIIKLAMLLLIPFFIGACQEEYKSYREQNSNKMKKTKYIEIYSDKEERGIIIKDRNEITKLITTFDENIYDTMSAQYIFPDEGILDVYYYCGPRGNEESHGILVGIYPDDTVRIVSSMINDCKLAMPEYCDEVKRIADKHGLDY